VYTKYSVDETGGGARTNYRSPAFWKGPEARLFCLCFRLSK